jgi:hypothetical protein
MSIVEQPLEWLEEFQLGWLAHYQRTGKIDWDKYVRPRNTFSPSGSGVNLAESRLLLISSSGAYLPASQEPFDAENPLGDYTIRKIPSDIPFGDIGYAHTHYDQKFVEADPQVLLPLRHLADMEAGGKIGEIAPVFLSFNGYHPNIIRVVKETIPAVLKVAQEFSVQAALLVPV